MHIEKSSTISRILIVGLLLLIGSQIAGCDWFSSYTDAEHVARGKEFKNRGELRSSVIELKNALQKNPKNAEARWLLGSIHVNLGFGSAAEKELKRSQELGIAREAILLPLAQALLMQGKNKELLDEIDATQKLAPPDQAKLVAFRGDALLGLRKIDKARAEYQRALEVSKQSASAKVGLARLSFAEEDIPMALKLVSEALEASPDEAKIWSFQGDLLNKLGDLKQAEESYTKSINLRHVNHVDRVKRALVRLQSKDQDGASEDVNILKKNFPNYFGTHYASGMIAFKRNDFPAAQTALEQSLKFNRNYANTLYYLGTTHLFQGHLRQAEKNLSRFMNLVPGSVMAHQVMAMIKFRMGNHQDAKSLLLPVIEKYPNNLFVTKLMAEIEFALENSQEGLKLLQQAAEIDPESASSHANLGLGKLLSGQTEEGIQNLQAAIELNPKLVKAQALVAFTYIQEGHFEKAKNVIKRLREQQPDSAVPLTLLGTMYKQQGRLDSAKIAFEHALEIEPGDPGASDNLAKMLLSDNKINVARLIYEQVLKYHPKHLRAQLSIAQLDAVEGNTKEYEQRLKEIIKDHSDELVPILMLGRHFLRYGQPEQAQTLLQGSPKRFSKNADVLALLVEAQLADKQSSRALITAKALTRAAPASKSAYAYYFLSKVYAVRKQLPEMRSALDRSIHADPEFLPSRIAVVKLLAAENRNIEASKKLEELVAEFPKDPNVLDLKGWLAVRRKNLDEAGKAQQEAFDNYPSSSRIITLAKVKWQMGERGNVLKMLSDWNLKYPRDLSVYYLRAGLYSSIGRSVDAQSMLEKILDKNPKSVLALNDLAWILRKKYPSKARNYAEKAYRLAPKVANVADTLAMIVLDDSSDNKRALTLLEDALQYAPNDLTLRYHYAIALEKTGKTNDAIETLEDILAHGSVFNEKDDAKTLLKNLTGS